MLIRAKALDYIGINYYSHSIVDVKGWGLGHLLLDAREESPDLIKKNDLGWDIYPKGLFDLLLKFKKYGMPIFILENGICTKNDSERWDFIRDHLKSVHRAIEEGVEVFGYLY